MMIANTASYVPKQFPAPSFSLGFTDSSQEKTLTQEGQPGSEKGKELVEHIANTRVATALNFAKDKSPPLEKQPADQFFKKFETPTRRTELSAGLKEKCRLA
ncbi:hypothetical protein Ahy_A01g001261 [Arachis hypogaea]|uniref:Uncharacterized protein n=1 Tax=Arachis hypogaea TaxID=3818 RepID=A0A445EMU1_ARAHY|nr:hypothetical protein Ahy_A01g001261 [Arachis hypogaea]